MLIDDLLATAHAMQEPLVLAPHPVRRGVVVARIGDVVGEAFTPNGALQALQAELDRPALALVKPMSDRRRGSLRLVEDPRV